MGSAGLTCGRRLLPTRNGLKQTEGPALRRRQGETGRYREIEMVFI
jgi:hypothetical protein